MAATPFRRILVPHDFSEPADRALREAAALASIYDGRLRLLHVLVPMTVAIQAPVPDPFQFVPQTRDALQKRAEDVLGPSRPPLSISVKVGLPVERILEEAAHADLIVVGTHGRTGVPHFFMGSVAESVVRLSPTPVLTIGGGGKPATRRTGRGRRAA